MAIAKITMFFCAARRTIGFCVFILPLQIAKERIFFRMAAWRCNHIENREKKKTNCIWNSDFHFHSIKTSIFRTFVSSLQIYPLRSRSYMQRTDGRIFCLAAKKWTQKSVCSCAVVTSWVCVRLTNRLLWSFSIRSTVEMPPRVAAHFSTVRRICITPLFLIAIVSIL